MADQGQQEPLEAFVDAGADMQARSGLGQLAAEIALEKGFDWILEALLLAAATEGGSSSAKPRI